MAIPPKPRKRQIPSETQFNAWVNDVQQAYTTAGTSLTAQVLAYCGLKSAIQLKAFLDSPKGKHIKTEVIKRLAIIEAMKLQSMEEERARLQLRKHAILLFLLEKLESREARAHQLDEYLRMESDRKKTEVKETSKSISSIPTYSPPIDIEPIKTTVSEVTQKIEKAEIQLASLIKETLLLDEALVRVEDQLIKTEKRYNLYKALLPKDIPLDKTQLNPIDRKIKRMVLALERDFAKVEKLLEKGEDDKARELMDRCNARQIHIEALLDIVAVIKKEKLLYRADGTATTAFEEAQFVLKKEEKIICKDGKYYIIPIGISDDEFDNWVNPSKNPKKEDTDKAAKALRAYERRAPDIMAVKYLVDHNLTLEQGVLGKRKVGLQEQLFGRQNEIFELTSTLVQLHNQLANGIQSPRPTPSPRPSRKGPHDDEQGSYVTISKGLGISNTPSPTPGAKVKKPSEHPNTPSLSANVEPTEEPNRTPSPLKITPTPIEGGG